MSYVDGFVVPVPEGNMEKYREMAEAAAKIWMKHGALACFECAGDDLEDKGFCATFADAFQLKEGETAVFAFIVYKSRDHRDAVNAAVMEDPEMKCEEGMENMPFDCKRMAYGGFKSIVEYGAAAMTT